MQNVFADAEGAGLLLRDRVLAGEGAIQHIWMTPTGPWRHFIFRIYWDGEATPSVESPVGDFFASGWGGYAQISSLAV